MNPSITKKHQEPTSYTDDFYNAFSKQTHGTKYWIWRMLFSALVVNAVTTATIHHSSRRTKKDKSMLTTTGVQTDVSETRKKTR